MKKIQVKAKSSSGEPYNVIFTNNDDSFTVSCTCQAGVFGKLCKHKTQLLQGDESMLQNQDEASLLVEILSWVKISEYADLLAEHSAIKKEIEAAKRKEQKFRRILAEAMKKGIPLKEKT